MSKKWLSFEKVFFISKSGDSKSSIKKFNNMKILSLAIFKNIKNQIFN